MYFHEIEQMPDFCPKVYRRGNMWYAGYRVPWGERVVKEADNKPKPFDSHFEAFKAASLAAFWEFRNRTTGFGEKSNSSAREAAEALFKPKVAR